MLRMYLIGCTVNYRGSLGFGQAPLESLCGKAGENDLKDCIRAADTMQEMV